MKIVPMEISELRDNASAACEMLQVLANRSRLLVMCHLLEGEKTVGHLQELIGLSQSALSQQLAILRARKLVKTRRDAQSVYYSIASPEAETVLTTLYGIYCETD